MAYSTIPKSTSYFNAKTYTGNGSTQSITGVGFQPDWTWIKDRVDTHDHNAYDAVRGVTKMITPNENYAESTVAASLTSFDSDGFTLGNVARSNANGDNFVSWNWKANGQGSANSDGTITTTYTSANTTSGFSISTYTGTGSVATIGHGLGSVPKTIIIKRLNTTSNWGFYHSSLGATKYLLFNISDAAGTASSIWNDTAPTSSVFTIGTSNDVNASGGTYVAYCFAEKQGFSKFGSYTGNGNTSGPFIYTGFKPAFVIIKRTDAAANFVMTDNKISFNGKGTNNSTVLFPSTNAAESDAYGLMLHSNGFKFSGSDSASATVNGSGGTYIYMAFGQPIVSTNGVIATAR